MNTFVQKRNGCKHCAFEEFLSSEQRIRDVLELPIPVNHPSLLILEEMCNGGGWGCEMKGAAVRTVIDERTAYQFEVMTIFKLDENRKYAYELPWLDIWKKWTDPKNKVPYAQRFHDIWEYAKNRLTPTAAYEIIVSEHYKTALSLARRLLKEKELREKGIVKL
jgi:hypothetical protein